MIYRILQKIYNSSIRSKLPKRLQIKNCVAVPHPHRLFDINYQRSDNSYEKPLLDQLRRVVGPNDDITIVGGGYGVSMILAGEHSYPDGTVTVIEASREQVKSLQTLASNYGFGNRINILHGTIGVPNNLYGKAGDPEQIRLAELPSSDIFILDCEGGELELLSNLDDLSKKPNHIIVETHGIYNAPPKKVRQLLLDRGYSVRQTGIEDEENGMVIFRADLD